MRSDHYDAHCISIANCTNVQTVGMIAVDALPVLFAVFALIAHAATRTACTPQSAAMAGGLSLGGLV